MLGNPEAQQQLVKRHVFSVIHEFRQFALRASRPTTIYRGRKGIGVKILPT
jgi:hypothetical protein